jgi:putative transposase
MEFASPPSTLPSSSPRNSHVGHRPLGCLQISSHTPSGESCPSASTLSAASLVKRPKLMSADRLLWARLCEVWIDWRSFVIVKPEAVIGWHRRRCQLFWTWKVRHGQPGRPAVSKEIRQLIRKMSREKPLWGAPRIHCELLKLGIDIGETSVGKYIVRTRKPPSLTWRTFLRKSRQDRGVGRLLHSADDPVSGPDLFLVLPHDRRRVVHFNVTAHPTAEWTAQQLREAFPFDQIPRYLLRDRNRIYGGESSDDVKAMGIQEVLPAPRSPWQRAYVERVIGTIRRECLDHVIVLNEASLYRHVKSFLAYYRESRTHLSLAKDTPEPRPVHPPALGAVVAIASWRTSSPLRETLSLNVAVLASNSNPGTGVQIPARHDKTPLFAIRGVDFSCFSIVAGEDSPKM